MSTGNSKIYTIGEAAKIIGVNTSVLRFWEKEFEALSPKKNKFGHRVYYDKDIEVAIELKKLLHDEGLTLKGAKARLSGEETSRKAVNTQLLKAKLYDMLKVLKKGH